MKAEKTVKVWNGCCGVKTRINFEFAATTVSVAFLISILSILFVFAPSVEAARVPAQKTVSPAGLISQIQQTAATPFSPFSQAAQVSQSKPVPAQKLVSDSSVVGVSSASESSASKPFKRKARNIDCSDLQGELDYHLQCNGNTIISSDTDVIHGGWLEVTGTLTFTGAYSLEVWQNGAVTLENAAMQSSATPGYQVIVYPGGVINATNSSVSNSREFAVESFAGDAKFFGLRYHDNARGLVLAGEGALVDETSDGERSKFYDNGNAGLEVWSGSRQAPNVVRNSDFYGTAPGEQNVGILVGGRNSVIGGNNDVYGNDVGILLNYSGGNQILNNNIHGNVKAGIKSFVASRVPDFVPAQALFEKNPVWSSVPAQPGGAAVDAVQGLQPNTISGNTITANGDGIIEYVLANNIDAAQAQLIANNNGYGFVGVDESPKPVLEASLGSNGAGKALYLVSTSVGAWIYYIGGVQVPDGPFYVAFCEGDMDCLGGTHNDARHYDDYSIAYTRQVSNPTEYFFSDLKNTSEMRNILGNVTTFTPKFLARDHSVDNNGNVIHFCLDAAHGYPYNCRIRAVSLTRYGDWLGRTSEALSTVSYWRPYYIFYDDGVRPNCNWWGALTFAYDENKGASTKNGRRPAVKIDSVPELNAVTHVVTN